MSQTICRFCANVGGQGVMQGSNSFRGIIEFLLYVDYTVCAIDVAHLWWIEHFGPQIIY